ncbi:MAG: phage tail assembly chaperone [Alphaproteobacteria bacterium]|nr:phage tail assembly chaperone [Alphaproteobacteria bacterium]
MGLAFGQLCLTPDQFWRMSPRELQAAFDGYYGAGLGVQGAPVMGRGDFDVLCAQFPDQGVEYAPHR